MLLELLNIGKIFAGSAQQVRALDQISLSLAPGEFVAVQGPSGSGKSTLLMIAGGLLTPSSGLAQFNSEDLYALSPKARARWRAANVGFVFQQFHLLPYLSVLDNVMTATLAQTTVAARDRAGELLEQLGLADRQEHVPAELSVGEKQRTALARALLHAPQLLLCDEPTGNLDEANAAIVLSFLQDFAHRGGAVLFVTHDERLASRACRRLSLAGGRLS